MAANPSIRRAMLRSVTIVLIIVYGLGSLGVYLLVKRFLNHQFEDRLLHELLEAVEEAEVEPDGTVSFDFLELPEGAIAPAFEDVTEFVQLWNHQGETLHRSVSLPESIDLPRMPTADGKIKFHKLALPDGRRLRAASTSFQVAVEILDEEDLVTAEEQAFIAAFDPDAPENRAHLTVTESDAALRKTLTVLALAQLFVGLLITLVTTLVMSRLVARTCRPIDNLAAVTAAIRPSELGVRLPTDNAPEELLPLVSRFNELLDQVERALHRERRFATDISHELRNPVAELRSVAEVAMIDPGDGADDDDAENPQVIYAEMATISKRLGSIIDVLTDLHRAQAKAFSVDLQKCTPEPIFIQSIESLKKASVAREITIDFSPPSGGADEFVTTDPNLLRSIIDNLLGNAIAHSPVGSTVECSIDKNRIVVRNPAVSLEAADLEHLSEPFWRKDAARSDQSHFGLGLSLVDAYANLLGAEVSFDIRDGKFKVSVVLPTGDPDEAKNL